jgi:hypothetical protein
MKSFTRKVLVILMLMHLVEYMLLKNALSQDDKSGLTREQKQAIFQEMHDKPIGGHMGMNRYYRMKLFTTWPGMKRELE